MKKEMNRAEDYEQKFGVGDFAILEGEFKVRIVEPIQDEDGSWWYEVTPLEFNAPNREVPQYKLKAF